MEILGLLHVLMASSALGLGAPPVSGEALKDGGGDPSYSHVMRCGSNTLFLFLILSGHPEATFEECESLPVSANGTSLLTIREAARRFQIDTEIRRYRPEEIDALCLPAIGQFKWGANAVAEYHFNVIYRVDAERVYVIDGTTGTPYWIMRSRLPAFWTGIALSARPSIGPRSAKEWSSRPLTACLLGADVVALAGGLCWLAGKYRTRTRTDIARVVS